MSRDFQNEQKFIYVLPTNPFFRQTEFRQNKFRPPFLQNISLVLVSVHA